MEGLIKAVGEAYKKIPPYTLNNVFITLMAQMNKILRHGECNNFHLSHTRCCKHEKEIKKSICIIRANVLSVIPTSSTLPTFSFGDANIQRNNETDNKSEMIPFAEQKHNKTEQAVFKETLQAPVAFHQERQRWILFSLEKELKIKIRFINNKSSYTEYVFIIFAYSGSNERRL